MVAPTAGSQFEQSRQARAMNSGGIVQVMYFISFIFIIPALHLVHLIAILARPVCKGARMHPAF
jgi:hypothetical protein